MSSRVKTYTLIFLTFFVFTSQQSIENPSEIKKLISQSDKSTLKELKSFLISLKHSTTKTKQIQESSCIETFQNCKQKYNYVECFNEKHVIPRHNSTLLKRNNGSEILFNHSQCIQIKEAYENNKQLFELNIIKTKDIVDMIKKDIKEKTEQINNEQRTTINPTTKTFLELDEHKTNPNSYLQKTMLEEVIQNFGNMFSQSAFIQLSPLNEINNTVNNKSNKELFSYSIIQNKVKQIHNENEKVSFLRKMLHTFLNLLNEIKQGYHNLNEVYEKSSEKCKERLLNENKNDKITLNDDDYIDLQGRIDGLNTDLSESYNQICIIKEEYARICDKIEAYCDRSLRQFEQEIAEIEDLLIYFE